MRWQNSITIYCTDVVNRGYLRVIWISMNERLVYFYIYVISSDTFYYRSVIHTRSMFFLLWMNDFTYARIIVQGTNVFRFLFSYFFLLFFGEIRFSMFTQCERRLLSFIEIYYISWSFRRFRDTTFPRWVPARSHDNQHILLSIVMYFYTCRRTYILDVYVEI